jgi:hypothetical protein
MTILGNVSLKEPNLDGAANPNLYTSGPYTYLDAAARLLVRKDEVIAAAECASFCRNEPTVELAVMAQPNNVPVVGIVYLLLRYTT